MIDVCMVIHDRLGKYGKYVGVTMCSALYNTSATIRFHILHDDTLSVECADNLRQTVKEHDAEICFYSVDVKDMYSLGTDYARFTVGTLFRLKILELLPDDIEKIVYLDSDLVVNLDIGELWNHPLHDASLAGCVIDAPTTRFRMCEHSVLSYDRYINAGVCIWNIRRMRRNKVNLFEEAKELFSKYPWINMADQDVLNYVFRDEIVLLDEKYNYPSVNARRDAGGNTKKIYHFVSDVPRDFGESVVDDLFMKYFHRTPWWSEEFIRCQHTKRINEKDCHIQVVYKMMKAVLSNKKKVFFGVGGQINKMIVDHFDFGENDYFVDNDEALWSTTHLGLPVRKPDTLVDEDKENTVIINTIFRYNEVKKQLEKYGYKENVHFFNGKILLPEKDIVCFFGERDNKWDL